MAKRKSPKGTIPSPREQGKPLTKLETSNIVAAYVADAEDYVDSVLGPERAKATEYYQGQPLGNEEAGRSQIVMSEVRDVVQAMLPSLMRVFLSTENAVEYAPRRADSVESAAQATDYANYVFYNDNSGAQVLYSLFKDALVRKTGIAKWYVNEVHTVTEEHYAAITDDQLTVLENDDEVEITELTELVSAGYEEVDPTTGEPIMQPALYDATVKRTVIDKKFIVEALPPEEFLIARNARDEDTAELIGHRKDELVSNLVAMGYDLADVMEHGNPTPLLSQNPESTARNPALRTRENVEVGNLDPSMLKVQYFDVLVRMDADGDGIAELHRVCAIGDNGKHILHQEMVADVNYAIFCPDPEPHTAVGNSMADQTMDLQIIKSNIVRNTLDSLSQSIFPRTGVVEGQVNMDDALNTEMGGIVRVRTPGAIFPLTTPFVGQTALPILAYLDDVRAQRTGITRATQGLDADVLQSTTKAAVTATVSAAQERLEMVARIFADGGMKRLFRGLLKMLVQNQDKARVVRLRGKWVEVNPAGWDADMDVVTNVGLGLGDRNEKIAVLTAIAAKQEEVLKTLGPVNPLVDLIQYRTTLGKIMETTGIKDVDTYWKVVTPDSIRQMLQTMQQNQKPDPAQILAQVEQDKTRADIAVNKAKLLLEERKMKLADDRERDRNEADAYLRAIEIQAKYGTTVDIARMENLMERQRTVLETAIQIAGEQEPQPTGAPM